MRNSASLATDWLLGMDAMEKIHCLQQEILKTSDETQNAANTNLRSERQFSNEGQ